MKQVDWISLLLNVLKYAITLLLGGVAGASISTMM